MASAIARRVIAFISYLPGRRRLLSHARVYCMSCRERQGTAHRYHEFFCPTMMVPRDIKWRLEYCDDIQWVEGNLSNGYHIHYRRYSCARGVSSLAISEVQPD